MAGCQTATPEGWPAGCRAVYWDGTNRPVGIVAESIDRTAEAVARWLHLLPDDDGTEASQEGEA